MDFDEDEDEDYGFDDEITDEGPEGDDILKTAYIRPLTKEEIARDFPPLDLERER